MKGEKRLKEIQERLKGVLKDVSPGNAEEYEVQYKPIEKYHSDVIGAEVNVSPRDSPAYGFYLVSKSDPSKSFGVMEVFRSDIIKKIPSYMEKYYGGSAFADNVRKGVEELQKGKPRTRGKTNGLETLGVISILSILLSIFLVSNNFTGFVISDLSQSSNNLVGAVLLLVGLTCSFFWFKGRKK